MRWTMLHFLSLGTLTVAKSLTSTDEEGVWHEGLEEVDLFGSLLSIQLPQLKLNSLQGNCQWQLCITPK